VKGADGLELHVTTYGPEAGSSDDHAPLTVLLAHCWTADEDDWHYQVRDLLARFGHGVRIVTWDHRGHGRSEVATEETCTIEHLARDLGAVVDACAPEGPLVLAGHSIGGMTIMALPQERPDLVPRVAALLFCSTSSGGMDTVTLGLPEAGPLLRNQIPRMLATRARLLSRSTRKRFPTIERQVVYRFLVGPGARRRDTGLVIDQLTCCTPATMRGFYLSALAHERTDALAAYDGVPTTVLVGSHDLLTPPHHGRRIAGAIRGASFVVAPGAGHMLTLERDRLVSDELIALVERALDGLTPT